MFVPSHKSKKTKETSGYTQGVYSSPLKLGKRIRTFGHGKGTAKQDRFL